MNMKTFSARVLSPVLITAALAFAPGAARAEVAEGTPAPKAAMKLLKDGKTVPFPGWEAYKGKIVVLEFWGTDCAPCVAGIPRMNGLREALAGQPVAFVYVSPESAEVVGKFMKRRPISGDIGVEGDPVWKAFGVRAVPQTVLIGKDGKVLRYTSPEELKPDVLSRIAATGEAGALQRRMYTESIKKGPSGAAPSDALVEVKVSSPAPGERWSYGSRRGGKSVTFDYTAIPLPALAAKLWDTTVMRVEVAPGVKQPLYTLTVKVPAGREAAVGELARQAMKAAYAVETRTVARKKSVLSLRRAEGAAQAPKEWDMAGRSSSYSQKHYRSSGGTMAEFAGYLEGVFDSLVVDDTGFSGRYEIDLEWGSGGKESLRKALAEELGLRLEPEEREVTILEIFPAGETAAGE